MKIAAMITEYNPFHNGHLYLAKQVREMTGADYLIAVMSGDFVQRGAPAITDKYTRAAMAVSCGIDAVFELPVVYATASAERFAYGAVSMLNAFSCIDLLAFGSECGDLLSLLSAAAFLQEESEAYRNALRSYQKSGLPYPEAATKAASKNIMEAATKTVSKTVSKTATEAATKAASKTATEAATKAASKTATETFKNLSNYSCQDICSAAVDCSILQQPNNLLGIEYLKALSHTASSIQPFTIKRYAAGYHDEYHNKYHNGYHNGYHNEYHNEYHNGYCNECHNEQASIKNSTEPAYASAEAIRTLLTGETLYQESRTCDLNTKKASAMNTDTTNQKNPYDITSAAPFLPPAAYRIFQDARDRTLPVCLDDFSLLLFYRLALETPVSLPEYSDLSKDLAGRICHEAGHCTTFTELITASKHRQLTYARISRALLHVLLSIRQELYEPVCPSAPYARLLAMDKNASPLLRLLQKNSSIPIVTKAANALKQLSPEAAALFSLDISAADLYMRVASEKHGSTFVEDIKHSIHPIVR